MTPVPALWPDARTVPRRRTVRLDRFLVVAVLVSSALRVPGLMATPSSDEAGFLLVARSWAPDADSLYGQYWVDRPPVLLAAYRWSDALLGELGPRLLALVLAAVLVVAVHLLAARLTSPGAARVATVVTVALLADPDCPRGRPRARCWERRWWRSRGCCWCERWTPARRARRSWPASAR